MAQNKALNFFIIPFLILSLTFSGCITYRPQPNDRSSFMERLQTQTQEKVKASVTVLSNKESKRIFGADLSKKGIQPVWVEIDNQDEIPYIFIPRNMDPNYYSTDEAAYMAHFSQSKRFFEAGLLSIIFFPLIALLPINYFAARHANKKMDALFNDLSMSSNIIMPKKKNSGFVFTSLDEGTKHVTVDLYSDKGQKKFNFVLKVPGIKPDYTTKDFENRYPEEKIVECAEAEFPKFVAALPCCTTNEKETENGDPFNFAIIGELEDIVIIFTSAGWTETEALSFKSAMKMAKAFFTGEMNRYSPISPLYYQGHSQDIAFQKTRNNINQRLHLRLWYTPVRYQKKPVWLGAISRDIGVKFTWKTWYFTTHKIDPKLDDARDYLLSDLIEIRKVSKVGFLEHTRLKESTKPKKNLTGDSYFTDNQLLIMELSMEDTSLSAFSWNQLRLEKSA